MIGRNYVHRGAEYASPRLLPPERWFAAFILQRQRSHRTAPILRIEQNYGPAGIALWAAGMVAVLPGQLLAFVGIVLLLVADGGGSLLVAGYWLTSVGVIMILLGSIRYLQGVRAGRIFRGDRPFVRRTSK
jgi:hypothetical protein